MVAIDPVTSLEFEHKPGVCRCRHSGRSAERVCRVVEFVTSVTVARSRGDAVIDCAEFDVVKRLVPVAHRDVTWEYSRHRVGLAVDGGQ